MAPSLSASSPAAILSSTGDLQILVNLNGVYSYQDQGSIPQAQLIAAGIQVSDAQNLTASQLAAIQSAVAAAAVSSTAAAVATSPCSLALFGDTSCVTLGSMTIGTTTLLVGGLGLALLIWLGSKK